MNLETAAYLKQRDLWPDAGQHILAHYNAQTVVVYQAYRQKIGAFAASNGYFGGAFSLNRMSWIKPNFLWMMYRSGWGVKPNQEVTLAIWLKRSAFDEILAGAVHSSFVPGIYENREAWQAAVHGSNVRLQWDPDHNPAGGKETRRAIQLGLRGSVLAAYATGGWIAHIEDISSFVAEQRPFTKPSNYAGLITPRERVYPVAEAVAARLGLDDWA